MESLLLNWPSRLKKTGTSSDMKQEMPNFFIFISILIPVNCAGVVLCHTGWFSPYWSCLFSTQFCYSMSILGLYSRLMGNSVDRVKGPPWLYNTPGNLSSILCPSTETRKDYEEKIIIVFVFSVHEIWKYGLGVNLVTCPLNPVFIMPYNEEHKPV